VIPLGLSSASLRALNATLTAHHEIRVRASVLTLSGTTTADVSSMLVDGQVNVDASADVTRTASLSLLDPSRSLSIDSNSPADAALFMDRMIRLTYEVAVAGQWVAIPVFTGPITKLSRSGAVLSVEASGKEILARSAAWRPLNLRKGTPKTTAIRLILSERAGETTFSIPTLTSRLPTALSLASTDIPWVVARRIANSLGRQLYYDGEGVCRLRTVPGVPVFTFTGAALVGPIQLSYSPATANAVQVIGATPKGSKVPVSYSAVAAASHPLSPWALGRNGVPRYLPNVIQDSNIRSTAEAKVVATNTLAQSLLEAVDASFDSVPIPHLDPSDVVAAYTDEGHVTFRLGSFSLPLGVGSPMSVGYHRNVSPKHRRGHK
jgi:hypothetical protein